VFEDLKAEGFGAGPGLQNLFASGFHGLSVFSGCGGVAPQQLLPAAASGGGSKGKGGGITRLHKRSAEGGDTPCRREGRSSLAGVVVCKAYG
jgi:hypothetical protein